MKVAIAALCVLASVSFVSDARAQFIWHVTHHGLFREPLHDDRGYTFTAISSFHNICMVAGKEPIDTAPYSRLVFQRSTDGGCSWREGVPSLYTSAELENYDVTKIEQIDELTTIAKSDSMEESSSIMFRTTDGGESWSRMTIPNAWEITDFDFSDSKTGIITVAGGPQGALGNLIYTTADGGDHWQAHRINSRVFQQACHSYGNGMFRVWDAFDGPLYTTHNNWVTYDSGAMPFDTSNALYRSLAIPHVNFGNGDTMIVFGGHYDSLGRPNGAISRTTDAGKSWTNIPIADSLGFIICMTSLSHDTLLASGISDKHRLLWSTNSGTTWSVIPVVLDTLFNVSAATGLQMLDDGHPIGLFSLTGYDFNPGIIVRGDPATDAVHAFEGIIYYTFLFPNPAKTRFSIQSVEPGDGVVIYDMLGREVIRGRLNDNAELSLDISGIQAGVYYVFLNYHNNTLPVGKIVVLAK